VTEKALVLLDRDNRELKRIDLPASAYDDDGDSGTGTSAITNSDTNTNTNTNTVTNAIEVSLTADAVLVLDRGYLAEYRREDLSTRWRRPVSGSIAAGREKAAAAGEQGLAVLNRYTGETIWRDEEPYTGFVLYREKIFAAGAGGRISAFSGPPNYYAPDTVLRVLPAEPNGDNGWYTVKPVLRVQSLDRETYVEEIKIRQNDGTWEDAPELTALEDGERQILAYGIDSRGLRGEDARLYLKVDTEAPESAYTLQVLAPESPPGTPAAEDPSGDRLETGGWYRLPVIISLKGKDGLSGLDRIWTSRGVYGEPVLFAGQGIHTFSWYAVDRAGNREAARTCEIKIDFQAPHTDISASYDRGICEVSISAQDRHSGIALIEYRINDGEVRTYREPLMFTREGAYQIRYRAADAAGNYSAWETGDIWVSPHQIGESLISSATVNGTGRLVMYHARNGMPVVEIPGTEDQDFDREREEAMIRLPSYTLGGEYVLWKEEDILAGEDARLRFRVNKDVTAYLFLPKGAAPPADWSFVEANVGINRIYYPGGTGVYMRRYHGGDWVELAGSQPGSLPPLILVQERGSVFAEIEIHREEPRNAGEEPALMLEAVLSPWQYSRRLPLRKRWLVNTGDGWVPLEGNRYEPPRNFVEDPAEEAPDNSAEPSPESSGGEYLRFRLEVYTPDGSIEYRTEKNWDTAGLF
jgi:hypothetical protein